MRPTLSLSLCALLLSSLSDRAAAQPGPGWGWGMGGGLGPHVEVLRARLGLSDGQVAKIQAIRSNLLAKQVKHRTATEGLWSKMALLDQAEIPDQFGSISPRRMANRVMSELLRSESFSRIRLR